MASSISELTECTVCYERFAAPKRLKCDHVFCHRCIEEVRRGGSQVKCPTCRKWTKVGDIVVDYRTFTILDAFKEQQDSKSSGNQISKATYRCSMCEEHTIDNSCKECGIWMCRSCTKVHNKTRDNITHTVSTVDDVLKPVHSTLVELIGKVTEKIEEQESMRTLVTAGIASADKAETAAIERSNAIRDTNINLLTRAHKQLNANIRSSFQKRKRPLVDMEEEMRKQEASLVSYKGNIMQDIKSKNMKLAVDGEKIVTGFQRFVESIAPTPDISMAVPTYTVTRIKDMDYSPASVKIDSELKRYVYINAVNIKEVVLPETTLPQLNEILSQKMSLSREEIFKVEVKIEECYVDLDINTFLKAKENNDHTYRIAVARKVVILDE